MLAEPYLTRVRELVNDLRSGRYEQTNGRLRRDPVTMSSKRTYCCLGVACEVANRHGQGAWVENRYYPTSLTTSNDGSFGTLTTSNDGSSGTSLPWSIAEWFGFIDVDPQITILCGQVNREWPHLFCHDCRVSRADNCTNTVGVAATTANDDLHLDFKAIADGFARRYLGGVDATPES